MTDDDLKLMYQGMWCGTGGEGSSHSRTKVGQNSLLLLEFVYANQEYKVYSLSRLNKIIPKEGKVSEQIRSIDDYEIDFSN